MASKPQPTRTTSCAVTLADWKRRAIVYKVFVGGNYKGEVAAIDEREALTHFMLSSYKGRSDDFLADFNAGLIELRVHGPLYQGDKA